MTESPGSPTTTGRVVVRSAPPDPADRFTLSDLLDGLAAHAREQQGAGGERSEAYGRVAELAAALRSELAALEEPRLS